MQSQTRNYILFFLSFVLIFAGYTWVRSRLFPPPRKLTPDEYAAVDEAGRLLTAATPAAGLGDAARLAAAAAADRDHAKEYALAVFEEKEKAKKEAAAKEERAKATKPAEPAKPAELIALGGADFPLAVTLTNRGAGVHDLTLTKFHAADWYGLPAKDANGDRLLLQLIPPSDTASFALYHYATADKDEGRPLDTLGVRDWQVVGKKTDGDEQHVTFATDLPEFGVRLVKTFTLRPHEYHLGLTVRVERQAGAKDAKPFRYQLAGGRAMPIEGVWYTTVFRNALFNWVDAHDADTRQLFDSRTLARTGGSDRLSRNANRLAYAAVAVQYFASAIVVADDQPKRDFVEFARATVESRPDPQHPQLDDITVRAIAEAVDPKPGEAAEHKYVLYHGPVKVALLEQLRDNAGVSAQLADWYRNKLHLGTLTDYGGFGFWSNFIIFCTNIVHWLIGWLRPICLFDGICIIVVTVIVRLAMMPISRRQQASMARTQEAMAKLKPEIAKLNERYKNDLVAKQQATMDLYRKHGVNPAAGLGGCLMLLLQMPIFLGLYYALQESVFFRLEPFLWVRNLAAPDMLFWWTENIPFISARESMGSFFYLGPFFNLLPVLALALMVFQMKVMQPPPADEQMAQQQKITMYIMIPMFAFMFYKMPSGLCLYFIATSLWGMAERKLISKKKPAADGSAAVTGRPAARGKGRGQPEPPPGKLQGWRERFREWWERLLKEASKK
ncbi:MAG TPA: membrane protein insertase YidC [Gemmataceae bacterium]|jgi:YidC/Oxa1 family membrane protein insertase